MSLKKALFIDRDGTILVEPMPSEQVDSFEKFEFIPGAISGLKSLVNLGYELVLASNQDGLGTDSFPYEDFIGPQNLMLKTLEGEGVVFDDILIDRSFPKDNLPTRKPGTAMLTQYLGGEYDLRNSYVIGDRETD
ncbi:MAG: histidinol-phosphatase, partial [Bacteroidales bacterium]|nr:histidinol-phosphatase [Bacteroidales bacterium]